MFFPRALSVVLLLAQSTPSLATEDALALLNQVGQRYSAAKAYRIEAITERTSSNELSCNWQKLAHLADALKSAAFLPEKTISVDGKSLNCQVAHSTDDDFPKARKYQEEGTVWIDKQTELVAKVFTRAETEMMPTAIRSVGRYLTTAPDQR